MWLERESKSLHDLFGMRYTDSHAEAFWLCSGLVPYCSRCLSANRLGENQRRGYAELSVPGADRFDHNRSGGRRSREKDTGSGGDCGVDRRQRSGERLPEEALGYRRQLDLKSLETTILCPVPRNQ